MRVVLLVLQAAGVIWETLTNPLRALWRKLFGDHRLKP